jgi:hypothetical protein
MTKKERTKEYDAGWRDAIEAFSKQWKAKPNNISRDEALVEHALSDRPGDWRVSIVGSRENDSWEMKVWGPNGFERSYTLAGSAGEHQPLVIASVLLRLLPARVSGDRRRARTPP